MKEKNLESADLKEGLITGERGLLRMFKKDMEKIQMLTQEEEISIARRSRTGDVTARNRLIESNLRFVLKVVFQYWSPGLPLMDMISEGCQGLIKAAKTFDPDKGFRFLTYAGDVIVQGVIRAIKDHKRYKHESLDELVYEDESELSKKDILVSEYPESDKMAFYNQVRDFLDHLSEREHVIITLRFWHGLSLGEIGLRINLAREMVRRVEAKALRKLRWAIEKQGKF